MIWLELAHGGRALIQCDWCPYKKRPGPRHTQRGSAPRTQGEGHLRANVLTKRNCSPTGRAWKQDLVTPAPASQGAGFPPAALACWASPVWASGLLCSSALCGTSEHSPEPPRGTSPLPPPLWSGLPPQGVSLLHAPSPPYLVNTP